MERRVKSFEDLRKMKHLKQKMPDFPRTPHLPYKPNSATGDFVASEAEVALLFDPGSHVSVQEKIDGANCGMAYIDGHPVIRNRTKILTKGFYKDTPAKKQFSSSWTWFYRNKEKFIALEQEYPELAVYGEWMKIAHGLRYDLLPDWFVAYDLYDYRQGCFLSPSIAMPLLKRCGFATVPEIYDSALKNWGQLEQYCNERTSFSSCELREGVYVKVSDRQSGFIIARYKMIRSGFQQGGLWEQCLKNGLAS